MQAATTLFRRNGISATSMNEVARLARVAPRTVLNHFATHDALTEAVIEQLMVDLREPSPDLFGGAATLRERTRRLIHEMAEFYQRSEPWYEVSLREGGRSEVLNRAEQQFYGRVEALLRAALGDLADDEGALAIVSAMAGPSVVASLTARGIPLAEAADLVADVINPWLERRAGQPGTTD